MTRIFFATDVHGSEICWKKFINAGKFYKADVIILGGDMTGKALVPMLETSSGVYRVSFLEQQLVVKGDEVDKVEKMIADRGYYPIRVDESELHEMNSNPEKVNSLFIEHVLRTAERWMAYADERLSQWGIKCYVCPGNDDMFEIDQVIARSRCVELVEGRAVEIDSHYHMVSTGWSNPTPWNTFRECNEEEMAQRLKALMDEVRDMNRCIVNFHAPPYGSGLDEAPELDSSLRPKYAGRSLVPVGSHAVKKIIEEYQPPLGLFGHIHESKGIRRLGRTICVNPGSSYEQGVLLGALIDLDNTGVKKYMLTSG